MKNLVPNQGSIPRPKNREEGRQGLVEGAFVSPGVSEVTFNCYEFTSNCPATGQPDFGSVEIRYIPNSLCIESRSLKFYLWSFRDAGAYCESLAVQILQDISEAIAPKMIRVTVNQNARGGIMLQSVVERDYND